MSTVFCYRACVAWKGAARLDQLLQNAGISSAQLGRELKVDPSLVSRWRNGERVPDVEQFAHMVRRAGASADEVLEIKPGGSVASRAALAQELAALAEQVQSLGARVRGSKG
jgi:transcriptional regulator with XRE-family HTH domain